MSLFSIKDVAGLSDFLHGGCGEAVEADDFAEMLENLLRALVDIDALREG